MDDAIELIYQTLCIYFFKLQLKNCEIQMNNKIITFNTYQSQVFNQLDKKNLSNIKISSHTSFYMR